MADFSKLQVGTTVYNVKDAVARNSLTPATQTKGGLMSAADKKKLDGISSGVFIIDVGSDDNLTDDYTDFCADHDLRVKLFEIDTTVPLFVRWFGVDGIAILPVSVSFDETGVIYTIWGDPLSYWSKKGEDANIIAIEYYTELDFVIDGFTSYRKVLATRGSEIAI